MKARYTASDEDHDPQSTSADLAALLQRLRADGADGHQLVAGALSQMGISHVYGATGTPVDQTFAAAARLGLRVIGVRHQQAAVLAAAAQNFLAGRLQAVALVSAGPAVTNTATGLLVARDNGWPVVVLGGRRPLNMSGRGSFQDLDGAELFRPISRWSSVVEDTSHISEAVQRAVRIASSSPRGPVYLDLPEDVLTGVVVNEPAVAPPGPDIAPPNPKDIRVAAELLLSSHRPLVLFGPGVRWDDAYRELLDLVNRLGAPFVAAPMARGLLPDDHPLCFTSVAGAAQRGADTALLVGTRLDWTFRYGTELRAEAAVVHVDDTADAVGLNRVPDVGILGAIKPTLAAVLEDLSVRRRGLDAERERQAWVQDLVACRQQRRTAIARLSAGAAPITPHRLAAEVSDYLPADALCVLDGNVSMAAAEQVMRANAPLSFLTAGANGCMGVGLPFAVGAKLARPERTVVVLCGDFAFGVTGMDIETAIRHQIPVIVVVANNEGGGGSLRQKAFYAPDYAERFAMFQPGIRYDRLVEALGGYGEHVEDPRALRGALERAASSGVAACVNVRVDPDAPYPGR
jgi:2-hydroxyacyl-CoA lyase 1